MTMAAHRSTSCCGGAAAAPLSDRHRVRLRYQGGRPIEARGPATGAVYRFSGLDRQQLVDPRDAVALLRSSAFRFDGVVEVAENSTADLQRN